MARILCREFAKQLRKSDQSGRLGLELLERRCLATGASETLNSIRWDDAARGSSQSPMGWLAAAGGLMCLSYVQPSFGPAVALADAQAEPDAAPESQEEDLSMYQRSTEKKGMPKEVILYQYEVCPFCNKVRAFLDYHKVPYRTVEVNPLTKKQLKWSGHKKVPVVLLDNEMLNDSSLIMSRLAIELEKEEKPQTPSKSWFSRSESKSKSIDPFSSEEEIKWRRWVDKRFVQIITVNIYRTMRESWQTFDYITEHGNFNFAERQAARVAGSGLMWGISGKLIKKYGIEGDLRTALYAAANEWVAALGKDRMFMGGSKPNLADLSMFGVIRSITGTDTFMDLLHNSDVSGWYENMMAAVGPSSKIATLT